MIIIIIIHHHSHIVAISRAHFLFLSATSFSNHSPLYPINYSHHSQSVRRTSAFYSAFTDIVHADSFVTTGQTIRFAQFSYHNDACPTYTCILYAHIKCNLHAPKRVNDRSALHILFNMIYYLW